MNRRDDSNEEVEPHAIADLEAGRERLRPHPRDTRLAVVTTGILLRRLLDDVAIEDVGCVVLDEFHERIIEMDLVLGLLVRIRQTLRPDLRIVVMSATLAAEPVAQSGMARQS